MHQNFELDDEIDFKELFLTLWRGKIYIILLPLISVFLASQFLHSAERKYTLKYNLKPVGEAKKSKSLSGLGGIASIAGIQLPSSSNTDFVIFKELITSTEVSEIIFENKKIIKDIFKYEWNEKTNSFSNPPQSEMQVLLGKFKKLLTGNKNINYMSPDPERLAIFIYNNIRIKQNDETGFLEFTSQTSNPELILSLIIEAAEASDKIMRQRYIDFSTQPLAFYKEKLRTARSREHREALAQLISGEEQKLMFASRGKYFIAEPYINPTISYYPTSPKPKLVLALSLVFGLFIGIVIIYIRRSIRKDH